MLKKNGLKATQVLLGEDDIATSRRLQIRFLTLGIHRPGPTIFHRAGLRALESLSDTALMEIVDESSASAKLTEAQAQMKALESHIKALTKAVKDS